jgi:hypothetical protein
MVDGYRSLYKRLLEDRNIAERIGMKVSHFGDPPEHSTDSFWEQFGILWRLVVRGVLPGGVSRIFHFVRSMPFSRPSLIPLAIGDWVVGLTMKDYVERHFTESDETRRSAAGIGAPAPKRLSA